MLDPLGLCLEELFARPPFCNPSPESEQPINIIRHVSLREFVRRSIQRRHSRIEESRHKLDVECCHIQNFGCLVLQEMDA